MSVISVTSGQIVSGIDVGPGQLLEVLSGGTAENVTILFGGAELVFSGGVVTSATVSSGGSLLVLPGGSTGPVDVQSGGAVGSTGVALVSTGLAGPGVTSQQILFGGSALFGAAIAPFETAYVLSGGVANSDVVGDLGTVIVSMGGEALDLVVSAGGVVDEAGGVASGTVVSQGGIENVSAGAVATFTSVSAGGEQAVFAGGSAVSTTVSGGGLQFLASGGVAIDTVVQSGGALVALPGAAYSGLRVQPGGVLANVALVSGASLVSAWNSPVVGETVQAGEMQYVLAGGNVSETVVSGDAEEDVYSGGIAAGTTLDGGTAIVFSGGEAAGFVVQDHGVLETAGGTASGGVVEGGGQILVGAQYYVRIQGVDGGPVAISGGGVAQGVTLQGGASMTVFSGGAASEVVVGSGAFALVSSGGALSGIALSSGGAVDLAYLPYVSGGTAVINSATDVLTVNEGGQGVSLQLTGNTAGESFSLSNASGGTEIQLVACFAEGTRILTENGEVAVQDLRIGDLLTTHAGAAAPVRWLGHRRIDFLPGHRGSRDMLPVRIMPGAFGPGRPRRALRLSPDHAVFVHGQLIPARLLVNGGGIVVEDCETVTYWHVELPSHGVIFAEGMEAESYLDTGNRGAFIEADAIDLHPCFERSAGEAWAREGFAPLLLSGPILEALRARLAERSASLGAPCPGVREVRINGAGIHTANIAPGVGIVRLTSEAATPGSERRRLGAALSSVSLDGEIFALDDARLARGFFNPEGAWRWTDGEGVVVFAPGDVTRTLVVNVVAVAARSAA